MKQTIYDDIPFVSRPSPERHLARLWWMGRLRGIKTKDISSARVLELGCATGRHMLSMAESLPETEFLGVDNSIEQIKTGKEIRKKCGLENVTFEQIDLLKFTPDESTYDYIFCHGLYSWTTPELQSRILELVHRSLTNTGVAYISHNTLPGWRIRQTVRQILSLYDDKSLAIPERVERAKSVISHSADRLVDAFRPYGTQLKEELERNLERSDSFFIHELLSENAGASTLGEIITHAREFHLQYIGDAHPRRMQSFDKYQDELPNDLELNELGIAQYLDLLHPTSFRGSLWIKESGEASDGCDVEAISEAYLGSPLVYQEDEHKAEDFLKFSMIPFYGPSDEVIEAKAPALKVLLKTLCDRWPKSISYSDLLEEIVREIALAEGEEEALKQELVSLYFRNLLDVYPENLSVAGELPERPKVSQINRIIHEGEWITTVRNELFKVDSFDKVILPLLDGSREMKEIADGAIAAINSGELRMEVEDQPIDKSDNSLREFVKEALTERLKQYLEQALLVE